MARRLNTRTSFISTFATHVSHELKSPLTSIQGAAELLRDDLDAPSPVMTDDEKRKFLDNIIADSDRLAKISSRLRDFARAENPVAVGATALSRPIAHLRSAFPGLEVRASGDLDSALRISKENAAIIFSNLADNAMRHGSTMLDISAARQDDRMRIKVATMARAFHPITAHKSSTAFSRPAVTAEARVWVLRLFVPCSTPMAAPSAFSRPNREPRSS